MRLAPCSPLPCGWPQLPALCRRAWATCCAWTVSGLQAPCLATQDPYTLSFELAAIFKTLAHSPCHSCCHTPAASMLTFPVWAFLLCFSVCGPPPPRNSSAATAVSGFLGDRQAEEKRGQRWSYTGWIPEWQEELRVRGKEKGGWCPKSRL